MTEDQEKETWLTAAHSNGSIYLMIVKDLTDGVLFPIYVYENQSINVLETHFISESRMKVVETIKINRAA